MYNEPKLKQADYVDAGREEVCREQSKHERIYQAVNELDYVINDLKKLLDRINPLPECGDKACGNLESTPSLVDTLNETPLRVDDRRSHMQDLIRQIEDMLF